MSEARVPDTFAEAWTQATSIECEQNVLGALLMKPGLYEVIASKVAPEDFSEGIHAEIFAAMDTLVGSGQPLSLMLLVAALKNREVANGVTLSVYLARLASGAVLGELGVQAAVVVKNAALRRQLITHCSDAIIAAGAMTPVEPTGALASELVAALDGIASATLPETSKRITLGEACAQAVSLSLTAKERGHFTGIPTGFRDLDDKLGGLQTGEGTVLAGRPSMGKTAVALEIAVSAARAGYGVLYVSLEMPAVPLGLRTLSSYLFDDRRGPPVAYVAMKNGHVSQEAIERMIEAAGDMRQWPLEIEQQPGLSVSQIVARARRVQLQMEARGIRLGLVLIDHLGLVLSSGRYKGNRVQEMGEISAGFHHMAKELGVHCLMLSQLNRGVESREDKRPLMSDLRESGDIEQNADTVISVYRKAYYLERKGELTSDEEVELLTCRNQVDLGILKQRMGETGTVKLTCDLAHNAIRDRSDR